jgi:cytochrome P450
MSERNPPLPPADFDPLAPETFDSPHALFAELRARCPVARSDAWNGFWAFTKYDDVHRAASDYRTYITSVQNVVPKLAFTGRRPPLHLDPPEHTPYRKALNPLLSAEQIARLEAPIRRIVSEQIDQLLATPEPDICRDFSSHVTIRVFAEWMNLSLKDALELAKIGREFNIAVQDFNDAAVKATSLKLYEIARTLLAARRESPRDPATDPVSALLAARDGSGAPLPDEMVVGTVRQVLVVGIIAPTLFIGSVTVHLSRDQALQQQLRAEPALLPAALEEFLRLYMPYRGFARTVTRPVDVRGVHIEPREPIAICYASACRDEEVFPEPDKFIMNRPNIGDALSFGRGPHNCVGAALARMELLISLQELLRRTARIELRGEPQPTRFPEVGAQSVPVRLTPASA